MAATISGPASVGVRLPFTFTAILPAVLVLFVSSSNTSRPIVIVSASATLAPRRRMFCATRLRPTPPEYSVSLLIWFPFTGRASASRALTPLDTRHSPLDPHLVVVRDRHQAHVLRLPHPHPVA